MMYLWVFNAARRRHELWARNPADPPGEGRVVAVQGVQGDDHSDLPADVQFTPYSEDMLAVLQGPESPDLLAAATDALNMHYQQQGYQMAGGSTATGGGQQQPQAGAALRDSVEDIQTRNELYSDVLTTEENRRRMDQAEYELRQQMAEAGYGPQQQADFFAQAGGTGGVAAPGGESTASFPGRMPNEYAAAYGDTAQLAQRAALMQRAQALQNAANAYARHQTGAERLGDLQKAYQARDRAAAQYTLDQQRLAADPSNDRRLRPMVGGQWAYDQQAGAFGALEDSEAAIAQMEQQWYPDVYAAEQRRKQEYQQGGWLPEHVRRQLYGDLPTFATGGMTPRESWAQRQPNAGPLLPTYADGGQFYYQQPQPGSFGQQPYQPPQPGGKYTDSFGHIPGLPEDMAEADAQFRQQSLAAGLDRTDIEGRIQRAQQQMQFRQQQIDQAHAQRMAGIQQQYGLVQQEVARQMAGLEQQRATLQQQWNNRALTGTPMSGQTWAG